ncbi:MAG TPA: DUF1214 domain-containing protein [Vicinamibacterales bacterium]|nr:DUF1214 domain-containing protein [Vicinamibacterales bacterium]
MTQILEHAAAVGHATARACSIRAGRWLVGGALRQPDAIAASDRSAVPEHQQPERGHGGQSGSISGHLFRPKAPRGAPRNWIQTGSGKGWNVMLRLYDPLQPWFDQTWRPGEIEQV